ncbi:uncharacterized protein PV09_08586 [Verruconis gallopava]|uniref:Uncharacterized protein n=1 Tax=Verruconis gallopava TaxID=253628 RepID=A0A0D1XC13_9PEZI|nr:uncharacterized protein PV09_08586 [Verruconis gallopava]KIV99780.1 hypothetical protein PV09_08586 [Verruconis gallopava]
MVALDSLTTGQVAGIIAAGISFINISFKLIVPLILVSILNPTESAATWSRAAAQLQGSLWPTILRTDSTTNHNVRAGVRFTTKLRLLTALLLSLASIITPLGLYESIVASSSTELTPFAYAKDASVFGNGTLPRPAEGFSRLCGSFGPPIACPNSNSTIVSNVNSTGFTISDEDVINVSIPSDYMAYLQSGAQAIGQTVSSVFDIGYRTYTYATDTQLKTINQGKKYAIGSFNQFNTLFLNGGLQLVEGLVVDAESGGLGFRNHSVPIDSPFGATWTEDILFIEPETQCVNTNLTFDYTFPLNGTGSSSVVDLVLVDHGGFANLNTTFPPYDALTAQDDPQLAYRAYRSAWLQNAYTALYYNVTNPGSAISGMKAFSYINSEVGNQIPMVKNNFSGQESEWSNLRFSVAEFGGFIDGLPQGGFGNESLTNTTGQFDLNVPDNPWKITADNFTDARDDCNAVFGYSLGNVSNILGFCGSALGTPQEKGAQSIVRFEPGSSYSQPLYGCASVVRAVIKTVSFKFNGTGLGGLSVTGIEEKQYASEADYPLWGVESAGMSLVDGNPLWGIIDPAQKDKFKNMSFVQKPALYLPGYINGATDLGLPPVVTGSNLPGIDFYSKALAFAYSTGARASSSAFDYSGDNNLGVYNKWASMSGTPEGAAQIINLIWTDAAANAVIGTKSWFASSDVKLAKRASGDASADVQTGVPVYQYIRRVRYHIAYAVPAFVVLTIFLCSFLFSFVMTVVGKTGPARMRLFLQKTSVGRVMTSLLHPEPATASAPTKQWAGSLGKMHIDFMGAIPRGAAVGMQPAAMHSEVYDPMLQGKAPVAIGLQEVKR